MEPREIRNIIRGLLERQAEAANDGDVVISNQLQGEINAYNAMLDEAIARQDEQIENFLTIGSQPSAATQALSVVAQALGVRADFEGIQPGFRNAVTLPATPIITDPTFPPSIDYPRGFVDTLAHAGTEGNVRFFKKTIGLNAAGQWDGVGKKPESNHGWEEDVANLAWVAHHTPIAKEAVSDYGQIEGIINNELMLGLSQAKSRDGLTATNTSGIVGVLNTTGIQQYTKKTSDNPYDSIRRMLTLSRLKSGLIPTHCAMSPLVREDLDLLKGEDKHYLLINVDGKVWSLEIVDEMALSTGTEASPKEGTLVYAQNAATWYTKETDNIEIGLIDDQFVKNAYTMLAEGRHALAVKFPKSFVYLEEAI